MSPPGPRSALAALLLALGLAVAGCSSKPPEADTAVITPDPAVVKPAPPAAPTPEAKPQPKE